MGVEPDPLFFEIAHHPCGSFKAKGGTARQSDPMHPTDQVHGMQGIHLTGTGSTSTLVHPSDGTFLTQDDSAAGQCSLILSMPHKDARDISDGIL
jgi:hypothetical protein